ncbi:MAG: two-component system regulatory protein YycI [Mycobacterium leprae]
MDWPKARAILLAAFTVVNLILAYSIWGPRGLFTSVADPSYEGRVEQVRATLQDRGIILPTTVTVPRPPEAMRFLHVEAGEIPDLLWWAGDSATRGADRLPGLGALYGAGSQLKPTLDKESQAVIYRPGAVGSAAHEVRLDNRHQVEQLAEDYLKQVGLLPQGATFSGLLNQPKTGNVLVEFAPVFDGYPVFSGYIRVEVSPRGIETIRQYWVEPRRYTDAPAKAVWPVTEALLRLAGKLDTSGGTRRVIQEIRLGYYANRTLTAQATDVNGWDTVPVWRISLDSGEVYYINAFNGEWES